MKRHLPTLISIILKFIPEEFPLHRRLLQDQIDSFQYSAPELHGNLFLKCGDILYDLSDAAGENTWWLKYVKAIWFDKGIANG